MNIRSKLLKGGHLSEKKCVEVLQLFCQDLTATEIAEVTNVSRVTVNNYCKLFRNRIAGQGEESSDAERIPYYGFDSRNGVVYTIPITTTHHVELTGLLLNEVRKHHSAVVDILNWKIHWNLELNIPERENINTFWTFTKARFQKFRGMNRRTIHMHIKESEYRYNHRDKDLYAELIKLLSDHKGVYSN